MQVKDNRTFAALRRGKFTIGALLLALLSAAAGNASAEVDLLEIHGQPLVLTATGQNREEVWNWFDPPPAANGHSYENQYHFLGSWVRVGFGYRLERVKGFVEVMSPYLINLPDNATAPPPQGLLGLGANYFDPNRSVNDASVFLKQGYLEFRDIGLEGLSFKGGRFEFLDGAEYQPPQLDPELGWLVRNRIAQRLVANFGFSDVMRSFDGAVAGYGNDKFQATAMYSVPTKGVFDLDGMEELSGIDLAYASLNAGPRLFRSGLWGNSMLRVFYIFYNDGRGIPLVDNRRLSGSKADTQAVSIDTIGADYLRVVPAGPGTADFLIWTAGQLGKWGNQNQRAYAIVAEAGYRLNEVAWKPWLRLGYTAGSGDDSRGGSTHGTFFQILPTPRLYAFFPFFNMMNVDDAMAQMVLNPRADMEIQASAHGLWLDSKNDLWYSGGGAFDNRSFGFSGRPSNGHGYLATLTDCQLTYPLNRHLTMQLYYGHAFGGSVIAAIYQAGRESDFGFIQMTWTL